MSKRYVVISADCHCGADLLDYRPYLDSRYHEEFDAWAATYRDAWAELDDTDEEFRIGVSSFACDVNWESSKRTEHLEREGIVAEVLFPNTSPPFFPTGSIGAPGPRSRQEYEYRFAGLRAHNRWLADFCSDLPGRRAGIAQVFLDDVDAAIDELRWAHEHGLRGVLLPPDHMLALSNLYYPRFDPFWAACAVLGMPVHRHGVIPSEAASDVNGEAPPAIGFVEVFFFTQRPLSHLILSGVFDRHPDLKLVMTENGAATVLPFVAQLDSFVRYANTEGTIGKMFGGRATARLSKLPSEYLRSNVYHGSFFDARDIAARNQIGIDRMMWGADYPHHEGTSPYTQQALRINFAGMPEDEVIPILSGTATEVYGLDSSAMRAAADRVGPTHEELNRPGAIDEVPSAERLFCRTFAERPWHGTP